MGKLIFRKIGGRLIPIKIGSTKDILHTPGVVGRRITATHGLDNSRIATMLATTGKKSKSVDIVDVRVEQKFQGHGISRQLFKHAQELFGRAGKKFMRSSDLQHVAQVKIRSNVRGPRGKRGSRFFADQFGPYQEETRRVKSSEAIRIIKQNHTPQSTGRQVKATTMIPIKFRRRK